MGTRRNMIFILSCSREPRVFASLFKFVFDPKMTNREYYSAYVKRRQTMAGWKASLCNPHSVIYGFRDSLNVPVNG
jgi:hypothetical protein